MSFAHSNTETKHSLPASPPSLYFPKAEYQDRLLDLAYDENVSAEWRKYYEWLYSNPDADVIPSRFNQLFSKMERNHYAGKFKVKDQAQAEQLSRIKKDFESVLVGHSKRRNQELLLADYIEQEVQPLGPIEYQRAGSIRFEEPEGIVSKLRACRQSGTVGLKPSGGFIAVYDSKCGYSKLCPDESRHESQRISESYIPAISDFLTHTPGSTFQYAVFSERNYLPGGLAEGKADLMSRFSKLLKTKSMSAVSGCIVVQEDPLSARGDWNVHLNVMLCNDGFLDWKAVRAAWGSHVHFEDERTLYEKTRKSLMHRGMDVSDMDRVSVLTACFREIAKYAGAPVSSKSEEKKSAGLTKAPPMSEWPPELWREWWIANKGFRRTRSYGVLYDPMGYRWDSSKELQKLSWLRSGGLDSVLFASLWRKSENHLSEPQRAILRDVMLDHEIFDIKEVVWVGSLRFDSVSGYKVHINLIPEDKFTFPVDRNSSKSGNPPTGPP